MSNKENKKREYLELLKTRYHYYRSLGYSAKEANALKHRKLEGDTRLKTTIDKKTNKRRIVKGTNYHEVALDNFASTMRNVENKSVYSNWGNLTQNNPYKDKMMANAYRIAKRDDKTLDYGYYYLYLMITKKLTDKEVREIAKTDKSFEMYVKGMKPKTNLPKTKVNKPKKKETSFKFTFLEKKTNKHIIINGILLKENVNNYILDGKTIKKDKYELIDWEVIK